MFIQSTVENSLPIRTLSEVNGLIHTTLYERKGILNQTKGELTLF